MRDRNVKIRTASSDIKRAFTGRGFIIGLFGMVVAVILSSLEDIINVARSTEPLMNGYHFEFIKKALSSAWVTLAIPILCSLPFTSAFVDDVKSGFIKQYLHRAGYKPYIRSKLLACGLSGGAVLFFGILISYALVYLVFTPMELALVKGQTPQPYLAQILMIAATLFLSGAFWSLVGFTMSALTMNRYMAYASPFILYYVLIILHERYFDKLYVLYPKEWLFPSEGWVLGSFGVMLLLAELTAAVCLAFALTARRRLANV